MSAPARHVLHVFSTFDAGGPQVRTAAVLELLPASWRHSVVAMDGRTACAARVGAQVRLEVVPRPAGRGTLGTARGMARWIRSARPDLVLTYNWGAIEAVLGAAWAGHRAVVHHEEGFGVEESERLLWRRNVARRWLLRRVRAVVVPSRTLERVARTAWRLPAGRVRYLPNGVDLARFAPRRGARREGGVVVGSVARFTGVKNQALLLRALAAMRVTEGVRLVLVGDGPERAACEALAVELGIAGRVEFAGECADTAEVYGGMDVLAVSSRTEQMPLVVLEAMACGLPVVATDVGDVAGMVAEANRGLVVAREDVAALAAALDRVVGDAGLREELGAANRRRCEAEFEVGVCLGRYVGVYQEVAGDGHGQGQKPGDRGSG